MHARFRIELTVSVILLLVAATVAQAADWPQWRGPERNGISEEKGLLAKWPEGGPKLLWQARDLGDGFSTPSVVGERLFLLENEGLDDEFVRARSTNDGAQIWSARIGNVGNPDQRPSYPGTRSTPTVDGDVLYALGSAGDLVCLETAGGKARWKKSLRADLGGKPGNWAYAESPLIDGDVLVCTPGGSEATLAALEKKSGDVIWKCSVPGGDDAAYASAIAVEIGEVRQYVQLLQKGLVGVEAKTGKLLWRYEKPVSRFDANIPTPLAGDGAIYVGSAGTGGGAVKLEKTDDGFTPRQLYFEAKMPTSIGGTVKIGEFLYGTTGQSMLCIEFATGEIKWQERALGAASIVFADDRLYLHGENGEVALVEPSPEAYKELGRFTPPDPPAPKEGAKAWAHPVVANGRLYIRERSVLWCFDVAEPDGDR